MANGLVKGNGVAKKLRSVIHLSLCDTLPAYGLIADMAFSYAWNGVRLLLLLLLLLSSFFTDIPGSSCS
jgi:hypothetical protein